MGADEVNCIDVFNEVDLNADGIVNLPEFAVFAELWQAEPNDPNAPDCDFNNDDNVDSKSSFQNAGFSNFSSTYHFEISL